MKKNKSHNKLKKAEKQKQNMASNNDPTSEDLTPPINNQSVTTNKPKKTPSKQKKESSNVHNHAQENKEFMEIYDNISKMNQQEKDKLINKFMADTYSIGQLCRSLKFSIDNTSDDHDVYEVFERSLIEYSISQYVQKTYQNVTDLMTNALLPKCDEFLKELPPANGMNIGFLIKDMLNLIKSKGITTPEGILSKGNDDIVEAMLKLNLDFFSNTTNTAHTSNSTNTTKESNDSAAGISFGSFDPDMVQFDMQKRLCDAVSCGDRDVVLHWLNLGALSEHRNEYGFTPLILAILWNYDEIVKVLLRNSADTETIVKETKDSPLSLACLLNRYEACELLLGRKANTEHRNILGYTPLCLAAACGYNNIIKLLLKNKAEINPQKYSTELSPLMLAALNGHKTTVTLLLDSGCDIHAKSSIGNKTALNIAISNGEDEIAVLILERLSFVDELTPLMVAAKFGYVDAGKILINKGVDVNVKSLSSSGDTALTLSATHGKVNFVQLLLDNGACVQTCNNEGCSPLWLAADGGHLNVIEVLCEYGADKNFKNNENVSCFVAAFRKGRVSVARWMLRNNFKVPIDKEWFKFYIELLQK